MAVVVIQYSKFVDDMFWEFSSILDAADFVKELAEWELQKDYSKEYISRSILERSDNWISVLEHLGLRIKLYPGVICKLCDLKLCGYEHYYFGCSFFRNDYDSDDYCPTCSDSDE